jgi:hypothetical protein
MKITDVVFTKSKRKGKKYKVTFTFKGKPYVRHFGALGYGQYKDNTPLKLYSHLDHLDKARRKKYYQRHGKTTDPLSPKFWSNKFLW